MKKIYVFLITTMCIISGLATADFLNEVENEKVESRIINFSTDPRFITGVDYLTIELSQTNTYLDEPGNPHLPMYQTVFEFSKNTKIHDVSIEYSKILKEIINEKIMPTKQPQIYKNSRNNSDLLIENKKVYESNEYYPNTWFDYTIKCGLNDKGIETTFVIVDIYPIRYQPVINTIKHISSAKIKVCYSEIQAQKVSQISDSYNLLIISPEEFVDLLDPLVTHKESIGIKTKVKTVEDILSEYTGQDQPEQIKYFIKEAKENWDVNFVLLMGGLKSYIYAKDKDDRNHGSTNGWHVPVRYTNIRHSNEVGVISDLYYSDLYRYNEENEEWEFEDWDSNDDGIFANSEFTRRDRLDLIPDLYVGRLACRTTFDANIIINKIIEYESSSPEEKPWYDRMIGIAGRTFDLFSGLDQTQQNDSGAINITGNEWQEFEPRSEILSRIELKIRSASPENEIPLTVTLEKPLGTIISSSEVSSNQIPWNRSEWISFDFQNVSVEPSNKYFISVSSAQSDMYSWQYSDPIIPGLSRYEAGNSSLGDDLDWCFKTFDLPKGGKQADGEYSVDTAFRYMDPLINEEIRVYWSNEGTEKPVPETQDIIDVFNQGAGYVNMEGHGNPLSWATHPIPEGSPFTGGLSITDFLQLKNQDKLPIVVVGGCHNALFNVSLLRTLLGRPHENWYWTSGFVTPLCFCWGLCVLPQGGAIASTGCTGLGLGGSPPDLENSGGLDCNFFYKIGNGSTSLGEAHSGAIKKYVLENNVVIDEIFCIVEFQLFGDPSLQLGGNP